MNSVQMWHITAALLKRLTQLRLSRGKDFRRGYKTPERKEKCIKWDEQQFVLFFILSLVAKLYFYISVWCVTFIHFIAWIKTSILQVSFQPWGMLTSMFTGCNSIKSPDIHLTVPVQLRWRLVVVVITATWTCLRDCGCSLNSTGASWPEYYA